MVIPAQTNTLVRIRRVGSVAATRWLVRVEDPRIRATRDLEARRTQAEQVTGFTAAVIEPTPE
jgi:hypothetical protein